MPYCTAPALQHTCDDYSKKVLYKLKLGALKLCLEKPSHMTPMSVYSYYIIILLYGSSANSNLPNIIYTLKGEHICLVIYAAVDWHCPFTLVVFTYRG